MTKDAIHSKHAPAAIGPYSQAIRAGWTVYLSGQIGLDPATGNLVEGIAHTTYPGRYKASDTFAPMGPFLVTRDEVPDPADLAIRCLMDDQLVASDHSANYVWSVADAISHISQTMTLLPGDIVSMGTAVGGNQDDPSAPHIPGVTRCNINGYSGEIRIEIERLGTLVNTVSTIPS